MVVKGSLKPDVIITSIFLSESAESLNQWLWAKKPALHLPRVSHFQNSFLMCRTEKERMKEASKTKSLLLFQTSPASALQMLRGGSGSTWSTFPISSAAYLPSFLTGFTSMRTDGLMTWLISPPAKGCSPFLWPHVLCGRVGGAGKATE